MIIYLLVALAISLVLGFVVMPRILLVSYKKKLFDAPDNRKVHKTPVPRLGGVAFVPIIFISLALCMGIRCKLFFEADGELVVSVFVYFCAFIVGVLMIYLIGLKDDLIGMGYKAKFMVQIAAASLLPLSGLWLHSLYGFLGIGEIPWFVGMPLTVLGVVYITNAINLIDGVDGLASGLSAIAFTVMCICCYRVGLFVFAMLAASAVGILVPFLYYNVRRHKKNLRKLFMGDTGSLTLGFIISFILLILFDDNILNHPNRTGHPFVALGALVIPLFDVVRVMMSRVNDGRAPFLPDMNHIHHKCLRTGMNARQTMVFLLCMSCMFVVVNKLLIYKLWANVLFVDFGIWVLMHFVLNKFIRKRETRLGKVWSREIGRYKDS